MTEKSGKVSGGGQGLVGVEQEEHGNVHIRACKGWSGVMDMVNKYVGDKLS